MQYVMEQLIWSIEMLIGHKVTAASDATRAVINVTVPNQPTER